MLLREGSKRRTQNSFASVGVTMHIAVQPMKIDKEIQTPIYFESTLEEFFVHKAHDFQESPNFPFEQEGREGGCQFAFDRMPDAPMRCIDCQSNPCECEQEKRPRYALQRFLTTRVVMFDIDLNDAVAQRRPNWNRDDWCKYHTLLWDEEVELRQMESRLMDLQGICFFYRTKCNGFRVAFESNNVLSDLESYENSCREFEHALKNSTPDQQFGSNAWFCVDGVTYKGQAYWSYPRVHNPVWLNPDRSIR